MQRLLASLLLVLGNGFLFAQEYIGTDSYPLAFGNVNISVESADFILPTSEGGYLLVGSYVYEPDGDDDGRVIKINSSGGELDNFVYNHNDENDHFYGAVELNDNYFFVGDRTENGVNYPVIIRTDLNLENRVVAWISSLPFGKALTIEKTYDNRILIGGYILNGSPEDGNTLGFYKLIDPDLTTGGSNMYVGSKIGKITRSTDGNYYMFGTQFEDGDDCDNPQFTEPEPMGNTNSIPVNTLRGDIFVAKYNAGLSPVWAESRMIGGDTPDNFVDGIATPDGGFALIGQTTCIGVFGDIVGPNGIAEGIDGSLLPYWFYKGTPGGTLEWLRSLEYVSEIDNTLEPFGLINSCNSGRYLLAYQSGGFGASSVSLQELTENGQSFITFSDDGPAPYYHTGKAISQGFNGDVVITGNLYDSDSNGDDFAFFQFSPEPDCIACLCVEDDPFLPAAYQCDNFNNYALGDISPQSGNWQLWPGADGDGQVEQLGAPDNQVLRIANDVPEPDVLYTMNGNTGPDITNGRHRLSWEMFVEPGAIGYYNFQYQKNLISSTNSNNFAFEMYFEVDGTGRLVVNGEARQTFTYPPGEEFEIAHIIDLEEDVMEFWLDHDYKFTMQYGERAILTGLIPAIGAIDFFASSDSIVNYWIDNICIRTTGSTPDCFVDGPVILTVFDGEVCTENGQNYLSACDAGNSGLYAIEEYGECLSICDYNAEFIGRDDLEGITASLTEADLAPSLLYGLPCVADGLGGSVSYPLYADIYILYNDTSQEIEVQNLPPDVEYFIFSCSGEGAGMDCLENPTDIGFYYIVIVSEQIADYNIFITPSSDCAIGAGTPMLGCGEQYNGTVTAFETELDVFGAYANCYSGVRSYQGIEQTFQLEITEASTVDIAFTTQQGEGGLFLFNANCGTGCINYVEIPNGGGTDSLVNLTLGIGNYYLVVDQETDIGNFSLDITCEYDNNNGGFGGIFVTTSTPPLPPPGCELSSETHEVNVQISDLSNFTVGQDYFFFNSAQGSGLPSFYNSDAAQAYNGTDNLLFNLPEDIGTDRCSYVTGDSLQLFIVKSNGNTNTAIPQRMTFQPEGGGVLSTGLYEFEGVSVISDFSDVAGTVYIQVPTSILFPRVGGVNNSYWLMGDPWTATTSQDWIGMELVDLPTGTGPVSTISSEGNDEVDVTVDPNPGYTARFGSIEIQALEGSVSQTIQITQPGLCVVPTLTSPDQEFSICAGESVMLSVSAQPAPAYDYRWSNGATGSSTTVAPTVSTTYTVTVIQATSAYCTAENTLTYTINVDHAVPAPISVGNQLICTTGESATLTVIANDALYEVDWYNTLVGGTPLATDMPTYTTNVPGTYYAQAKDRDNGNCVSQRIPVSLILNPPINLTTEQSTLTICADDQVTLNAQLSGGSGAFTYQWRNQNGQLLSTQPSYSYDPAGSGTETITLDVFDSNDCSARQDFVITAVAPPSFTNYEAPDDSNCSEDLLTYEVTFNTDGTVLPLAFGQLIPLEGNNYQIIDVPAGQGLTVVIANTACSISRFVPAPSCSCATNIPPPVSMGDVIVCDINGVVPLEVTLTASEDYTVNWYSETGGLVLANSLTLPTNVSGTYFAQTVNVSANQCTSPTTTPVTLEIRPELTITGEPTQVYICEGTAFDLAPSIAGGVGSYTYQWRKNGSVAAQSSTYSELATDAGQIVLELEVADAQGICTATETFVIDVIDRPELELEMELVCAGDLATYSFDISSNTGDLMLSVPQATLQDNGNGNYTILNVPIDSNIVVTGVNTIADVSCDAALAVTAPDCSCETGIPPPINAGDVVVCAGDIIPPLTVSLEDAEAYTVNWYNADGGLELEDNLMFTTQVAGIYYAETVDAEAAQCISATRTAVVLEIVPEMSIVSDQTVLTICQGETFTLAPDITGGLSPYTYSWRKNGSVVGQAPTYNETIDDLVPVIVELEVQGAQGICLATETFVVSVISPPIVSQVPGIMCSEDLTTYSFDIISSTDNIELSVGEAILTSNGGASYTVSNVPVETDIIITGINSAGMLECPSQLPVSSPDDCNCAAQSIPIAEPVQATYTACANDTLPTFEIVSPADNFIVEWYNNLDDTNPFQTGELTYEPSGADTVYVLLRDEANGCTSESFVAVSLVINEVPTANAGQNIDACVGSIVPLNGTASEGEGVLTYAWSEELPLNDPNSVTPLATITQDATITLTVTDENGCSSTDPLQINVLASPELTMMVTEEILCFGNPTGAITAEVISGTLPYGYLWSTGAEDVAVLTGLIAGEYVLTVTDNNGCVVEEILLLTEPEMLTLSYDSISPVTNNNDTLSAGVMNALIGGGTPPYEINWLNEAGISVSDSVTLVTFIPGTYRLLVRDANGCDILATGIVVDLVVGTEQVTEVVQQLTAFPNPTEGSLRIVFTQAVFEPLELVIYDILGRPLSASSFAGNGGRSFNVDLTDFPSGTYWISVRIADENHQVKIIKS